MKKILLTALLASATVGAFAQGTVQFRNYWASTTPPVDGAVHLGSLTGARLNSSNPLWRAALIGGPTTATAASVTGTATAGTLQLMAAPSNPALTYGTFRSGTTPPIADGYVNYGATPSRAVPGVDYGGTALVQMVAWQGNYDTWAAAFAAWSSGTPDVMIGVSNPLTLQLPSSAQSTTLTYLWGLNSFAIVPVPEPTAFALAGLGAAALFIFRRRN